MRKSSNRILFGVCGGLANYISIDPFFVRLIFVGIAVWTQAPIIVAYIILALLMSN
jgi:phage shock protein C